MGKPRRAAANKKKYVEESEESSPDASSDSDFDDDDDPDKIQVPGGGKDLATSTTRIGNTTSTSTSKAGTSSNPLKKVDMGAVNALKGTVPGEIPPDMKNNPILQKLMTTPKLVPANIPQNMKSTGVGGGNMPMMKNPMMSGNAGKLLNMGAMGGGGPSGMIDLNKTNMPPGLLAGFKGMSGSGGANMMHPAFMGLGSGGGMGFPGGPFGMPAAALMSQMLGQGGGKMGGGIGGGAGGPSGGPSGSGGGLDLATLLASNPALLLSAMSAGAGSAANTALLAQLLQAQAMSGNMNLFNPALWGAGPGMMGNKGMNNMNMFMNPMMMMPDQGKMMQQQRQQGEPQGEEEDNEDENMGVAETYADYMPAKLKIGRKHPDPVVETASLSSVEP
ncbi:hypothetical protein WDU94_010576, partial [Cyamophila willieti]